MMTSVFEYLIQKRIRKQSYKLKVTNWNPFLYLSEKFTCYTFYTRIVTILCISTLLWLFQKAKTLLGELGKKLNGKKEPQVVENIYSGEETPLRPNLLAGAQENKGVCL